MRKRTHTHSMLELEALEARLVLSAVPPRVFENGEIVRSIVVADFNGDGKLDMAVSTANQVSLLRGRGDGRFRPAVVTTLAKPAGQLAAGQLVPGAGAELISVGSSGIDGRSIVRVLAFNPEARRLEVVTSRRVAGGGWRAAAADLKGDVADGNDEIILTSTTRSVLFELSEGGDRIDRYRVILVGVGPLAGPAIGDIDGDGRSELVFIDSASARGKIIQVSSSGGDTPVFNSVLLQDRDELVRSVFVGDMNNDTRMDVLFSATTRVSMQTTTLEVLLNSESGLDEEPMVLHQFAGEDDRDVDSAEILGLGAPGTDGWREVRVHRIRADFLTLDSAPVALVPEGGGTFSEIVGHTHIYGNGIFGSPLMQVADFQNDGRPDVIWGTRQSTSFGTNLLRLILDSSSNQAPTIETPLLPRGPFQRGETARFVVRPMDAEFLLGRAQQASVSLFLDTNQNGVLDDDDRHMVTGSVTGFDLLQRSTLAVTIGFNWELGSFAVFARATDAEGLSGPARRLGDARTMGLLTITD